MGLDQWATAHKGSSDHSFEFYRWRKHADLQGFMSSIWCERNPTKTAEDFNCVALELDADILTKLMDATRRNSLPHTTGFFFGSSDDIDRVRTIEFCCFARVLMDEGYTVTYHSWW